MKLDLELIYHQYIISENKKVREPYKKKFKGWFSASSAGQCFKKQLLRAAGKAGAEPEGRVGRLLRLGTIVHIDMEKALERYAEEFLFPDDGEIYIEEEIKIPELNVVGHLDIANKDKDELHIYDIKTVASYKWRKQFGRIANRDKNPSVNYEQQIGTYGIGMANEHEIEPHKVFMYLCWYNKDNSAIKIKEVPSFWMDNAFEYWTNLNEAYNNNKDPESLTPGDENVPVMDWECRYCEYQGTFCEGKK